MEGLPGHMIPEKKRCKQMIEPYGEVCGCISIANCQKCGRDLCFEHIHVMDKRTILCVDCFNLGGKTNEPTTQS